jgi:hypothetical protein
MAELAYAVVSKTIGSNPVWVQVPLKPPDRSSPLPPPKISAKDSPGPSVGPSLILVKKSQNLHIFLHSCLRLDYIMLILNMLLEDAADSKSAGPCGHGGSTPSRHHKVNNLESSNIFGWLYLCPNDAQIFREGVNAAATSLLVCFKRHWITRGMPPARRRIAPARHSPDCAELLLSHGKALRPKERFGSQVWHFALRDFVARQSKGKFRLESMPAAGVVAI